MKNILTITEQKWLPKVDDIIHDCEFDKDKITFSSVSSILEIEFNYAPEEQAIILRRIPFLEKRSVPLYKYILGIANVQTYQILGDSGGGPGTTELFNVISYEPQKNLIKIKTVFAKEIDITVSKLELFIEDSGEKIGERIYSNLFLLEHYRDIGVAKKQKIWSLKFPGIRKRTT